MELALRIAMHHWLQESKVLRQGNSVIIHAILMNIFIGIQLVLQNALPLLFSLLLLAKNTAITPVHRPLELEPPRLHNISIGTAHVY